jgi:CRP/FNR family transcriptional regulator, cyclic AMP receptor protein
VSMETSSYFVYPTVAGEPAPEGGQPVEPATPESGRLAACTEEEWDVLLAYIETRRFRPGDWLIGEGEHDRALYLVSDGRLEPRARGRALQVIDAPATVGELAFLDGGPRIAGLRALTHGEAQRLSYDAFEALAARRPQLARELLLDIGRTVAARLRALEAEGE